MHVALKMKGKVSTKFMRKKVLFILLFVIIAFCFACKQDEPKNDSNNQDPTDNLVEPENPSNPIEQNPTEQNPTEQDPIEQDPVEVKYEINAIFLLNISVL